VEPIPSREWPTAAERPADSRLDSTRFERAFGYAAPPWAESVGEIVRRLLETPPTEESRP
jgi:dTDP-4-dehydrorhamnose reductase